MVERTISLILAGSAGPQLRSLTTNQPAALVPIGGLFRVVDFTMSALLNSDLRRIYLLGGYRSDKLQSYFRDAWTQLSREFRWDLDEDLTCLPPEDHPGGYLDLIEKSKADNVLVASGDQVHQMDFGQLLRYHIDKRADVTLCSVPGVFVFRKDFLIELLRKSSSKATSFQSLATSVLARRGRVVSWAFNGYWRSIDSIEAYHAVNMDLLGSRPDFDPYAGVPLPVRMFSGNRQLEQSRFAADSRVALGARLFSCSVRNSIVSAGARVDSGAEVVNCVVLAGSHIAAGARVRNAVIAENATVRSGAEIGHEPMSSEVVLVETVTEPIRPPHRRSARVALRQCGTMH